MLPKTSKNPTMLVILDGFGYQPTNNGNAVVMAKMPFWSHLLKTYPHTLLHAAGEYVGLPDGFIGNSEVGHLTIGSGRIVESILKRFNNLIDNGAFFQNQLLIQNFNKIKQRNQSLHLMGLLSDGGVHSHERHLHTLLKLAAQVGLKKVFVHAFLDGRDVAPTSAAIYLDRLQQTINDLGVGQIASICGRFYAMDRDKNWDRTERCYQMLVGNVKYVNQSSWQDVLKRSYQANITDEFIEPTMLVAQSSLKSGDGVIFFNFRPDRARQIAESLINPTFTKFMRPNLELGFFISTARYEPVVEAFNNQVLFEDPEIRNTLLDVFANQKQPLKVFIIAETEKYAHVTYFFRGMVDKQLPNESRVLIPSIKVKNYIEHPEMSAPEITKTLLKSLQTTPADFYLVNYANPDMVGHSGNLDATIKACQCIDQQLKLLYDQVVEKMDGSMFITSDHGNAEEKINLKTGQQSTAHTTSPVPFVFVNRSLAQNQKNAGWSNNPKFGIASISPTILKFLGIQIPDEMISDIIEEF